MNESVLAFRPLTDCVTEKLNKMARQQDSGHDLDCARSGGYVADCSYCRSKGCL